MTARIVDVVAAVVRDHAGRMLVVRKRGTTAFMQPGGKREPGYQVRAAIYALEIDGAVVPAAEIDEIRWVDPHQPPDLNLAPLTRSHVLPLVAAGDGR